MTDLATVLALAMDEAFPDDWYGHMVELLETKRGHALAALVEAALAWREALAWRDMPRGPHSAWEALRRAGRLEAAIDAYREATR